jgi:SAM-dependent methyltransferase
MLDEGSWRETRWRRRGLSTQTDAMVDRVFTDRTLAQLYDASCAGRPDFAFYLPLVMTGDAVLDVGCGTGELLRIARQSGHPGRLCGLDPAEAMLEVARGRTDIEWILGDLSSVNWESEFDLVVMTGHAFQVFLGDEELRLALTAIREALTADGRFVFETRNPPARAWERWVPENVHEIVTPAGAVVRSEHQVDSPVRGELVSFTNTFTSPAWDGPRMSRSTLRFLDVEALDRFLADAGLGVVERFGDWDRRPLTDTSPEIITVARRV